jgi:hypothetical protein
MLDVPFPKVVVPDFEFRLKDPERPDPLCVEALELRSGEWISQWQDGMGPDPPYDVSRDTLFIAFAADAEMECHRALGWKQPACVIDLRIEFLRAINTTPRPPREKDKDKKYSGLAHALTYYGLDIIDVAEKERWRATIKRGPPYSAEEHVGIQRYCRSDVRATVELLAAMIRRGHLSLDGQLPFILHRGRCMRAAACIQSTGVPVDVDRHHHLTDGWEFLRPKLIGTLGRQYDVYDEKGSFSEKRFIRYLSKRRWPWPLLESGRLDLKDKTFKHMAQIYPELEPLRQLRYCLDQLKLGELPITSDGFNCYWLNSFGSSTGRNYPSNTKSIFGPAVWLRDFLIQPKSGSAIVYIDWIGQEFGIAAGLSHDPAMMEAYQSGDIYLAFGKQAGILPQWATAQTHPLERELLKVCVLATLYGQGHKSLAEQLRQPEIVAREILRKFYRVYRVFGSWLDNRVNRYLLDGKQQTVFGWTHYFREMPRITSVRNFDMQANGAEMLRLACCLGTEAGISICAPVHDAILIQAPLDRLDEDIARMRGFMAEASRVVLDGFELRTDHHIFRYPEHYSDPKGRGRLMLETVMKLL